MKPELSPIAKKLFPKKAKLVEKRLCPLCEKKVSEYEFRDEYGKKEYLISGMCQKCQDKVFKKEE